MDEYCEMRETALSANLKRSVGSPLGVKVDFKGLRMQQQLSVSKVFKSQTYYRPTSAWGPQWRKPPRDGLSPSLLLLRIVFLWEKSPAPQHEGVRTTLTMLKMIMTHDT